MIGLARDVLVRSLAAVAGVTLAALALSIGLGWAGWLDPEVVEEPVSASLLVESFSCRRGERRTVLRRGVEDGYAPGNFEPSRRDRSSVRRMTGVGNRDYDEGGLDREFTDFFEPPRDTVSGLFVIRMIEADGVGNDSFILGDAVGHRNAGRSEAFPVFISTPSLLDSQPYWSRTGDVYSVPIEQIVFADGRTLTDYIRDPVESGMVDVSASDDTAVDFMALVTCSPPDSGRGMTFSYVNESGTAPPDRSLVRASCFPPDEAETSCDPFVGETDCGTALPLICYRPDDSLHPDFTPLQRLRNMDRYWSGGEFALSPPVAGQDFATIVEADAYCRANFGEEWRLADFHLGGRGFDIVGLGPTDYTGRVWIDIRDQPYATCWARE